MEIITKIKNMVHNNRRFLWPYSSIVIALAYAYIADRNAINILIAGKNWTDICITLALFICGLILVRIFVDITGDIIDMRHMKPFILNKVRRQRLLAYIIISISWIILITTILCMTCELALLYIIFI